MVKKPAGAGNNNIGMLQFLNLRIDSHAAVNSNAFYTCLPTQGFDSLMNLFGQLPGGGDDQTANARFPPPYQPI